MATILTRILRAAARGAGDRLNVLTIPAAACLGAKHDLYYLPVPPDVAIDVVVSFDRGGGFAEARRFSMLHHVPHVAFAEGAPPPGQGARARADLDVFADEAVMEAWGGGGEVLANWDEVLERAASLTLTGEAW